MFKQALTFRYLTLAILSAIALTILCYTLWGWHLYLCWLLSMTIVTYFIFRNDKSRARRGVMRLPNRVLLGTSLLGGMVGGWLGMYTKPRHKNRQLFYWLVMSLATFIHFGILYGLFFR